MNQTLTRIELRWRRTLVLKQLSELGFTISFQAVKAALANPVKDLRTE